MGLVIHQLKCFNHIAFVQSQTTLALTDLECGSFFGEQAMACSKAQVGMANEKQQTAVALVYSELVGRGPVALFVIF